jgi:dihydrofolate reductase
MAKLIYSAIASLDGYVTDEDGDFDWAVPDEEVHTFINDLARPLGTYLYGHRMYETMVGWETDPTLAEQSSVWRSRGRKEMQDRTKEVAVRKVVVSEFVSLDGVMEDPSWESPFRGEEQEKFKFAELAAADALLLGRKTYEGPRREALGAYTDMMNGYPKQVASTTLQEPLGWNNSTIIKGNIPEEVDKLKQQEGKDILVFGSADLMNTLMRHGLVDELRLMVFPIIVGKGLFEDGRTLKLVDSKTFGTGVVSLAYRPERS